MAFSGLPKGSKKDFTYKKFPQKKRPFSSKSPLAKPNSKRHEDGSFKYSNCPIQAVCQSCPTVNKHYKTQADLKYAKSLDLIRESISLENTRCLPLELSPQTQGYRCSAKLAVRKGTKHKFDIGLFQPGSHQLTNLESCFVQDPAINDLTKSLRELLETSEITPYDEASHTGDLRYLMMRVSHKRKELSLTFVATSRSCYTKLRDLVKLLKETHNIASAFLNLNPDRTNRITGLKTKKIFGSDQLKENLCHFDLQVNPLAFFQVNPYTASKIYSRVEQLVGKTSTSGTRAWDLYCGVGIFSLVLLRQGYHVVGVEENPFAVEDAKANAKRNFPEGSFSFHDSSVEEFIEKDNKGAPELSVINPSRSGLTESVVEKLIELKKQRPKHRTIYISCEASSLARDLSLLSKGGYTVSQLESFDMFPHTEKLEWICVLT